MFTQATDELALFSTAFAGFEYFPYFLLAGIPLFLFLLALSRRPVALAASTAAAFAPTIDSEISNLGSTGSRSTRKLAESRAVGWGFVGICALVLLMLLLSGWRFPGADTIQGFTTAGWWGIGILVVLTLPAILRRARRQNSLADRLSEAATWLLASAGAMSLVIAAVGLGLSTPGFRAWFETPSEPQPTAVTTEKIVPSSVTFKSGSYFGFLLGGTSPAVSGLVEADDGVRTFSTSRYRYGDDWQLTTEKTCTTTSYSSPLVIQKPVSDKQCFTSTIAVLGDEITEN